MVLWKDGNKAGMKTQKKTREKYLLNFLLNRDGPEEVQKLGRDERTKKITTYICKNTHQM